MDRGAWRATVLGVAKSRTRLSTHTHTLLSVVSFADLFSDFKGCLFILFIVSFEMAIHSSILAWRIPWTEELGGLESRGLKESDTTERLHFHFNLLCKKALNSIRSYLLSFVFTSITLGGGS